MGGEGGEEGWGGKVLLVLFWWGEGEGGEEGWGGGWGGAEVITSSPHPPPLSPPLPLPPPLSPPPPPLPAKMRSGEEETVLGE